jgi:thiol:disulfide interchange protein DsbD
MNDSFLSRWAVLVVCALLTNFATAGDDIDDPFSPANQVKVAKAPVDDANDPFAPSNQLKFTPKPKVTPTPAKTSVIQGMANGKTLIDFEVSVSPSVVRRGEKVTLTVKGTPRPGYRTYPITRIAPGQNEVSELAYKDPDFKPLWPMTEGPAPERYNTKLEPPEPPTILAYFKPFTWAQELVVSPSTPPGERKLHANLNLQVCNENNCFPLKLPIDATVTVTDAAPIALPSELEKRLAEPRPEPTVVSIDGNPIPPTSTPVPVLVPTPSPMVKVPDSLPDSAAEYRSDMDAILASLIKPTVEPVSLLSFILAGMFWGGVSLVTPCVFPMIPITVSYFLKQSEKENKQALTKALIYSGTIIIVLTIAAVALLSVFRWLSVNPIMNFGLGLLFIYFALSLFGMYEIELPHGLAKFTSSREGQGGVVGTIFMALTFTIVSFACVAPFLGGFGGTSAGADVGLLHRFFGGLAFATTFAAPFFVLALFPTLLKKMPKSGSWLNSVKVVMGFLEFAAALKFLRAGELVLLPTPVLFTYDLVLGLWIALAILCGCYLLGFYRLPHDSPAESIAVPRLVLGAVFLGFAFYLLPALFKVGPELEAQRPHGLVYAWVDSFLLPEPSESKTDIAWSGNLKAALASAREDAKRTGKAGLVFIDFTGETCTNCKINEKGVFSKPEVRDLFAKYHRVQLFNDKVPDKYYSPILRTQFGNSVVRQKQDAEVNFNFEAKGFDTTQLPLYVILEPRPDGKVAILAKYEEGKINDEAGFIKFLSDPVKKQ